MILPTLSRMYLHCLICWASCLSPVSYEIKLTLEKGIFFFFWNISSLLVEKGRNIFIIKSISLNDFNVLFREYSQRVNRISFGKDRSTLMLMMKEEKPFAKAFKKCNIDLKKIKASCLAVEDIQPRVCAAVVPCHLSSHLC